MLSGSRLAAAAAGAQPDGLCGGGRAIVAESLVPLTIAWFAVGDRRVQDRTVLLAWCLVSAAPDADPRPD